MKKKNINCSIRKEKRINIHFFEKKVIFSKHKKKQNYYFLIRNGCHLRFPVFNRNLFFFFLNGIIIKKHLTSSSINQTVTIECKLSRNKLSITIPINALGLHII